MSRPAYHGLVCGGPMARQHLAAEVPIVRSEIPPAAGETLRDMGTGPIGKYRPETFVYRHVSFPIADEAGEIKHAGFWVDAKAPMPHFAVLDILATEYRNARQK